VTTAITSVIDAALLHPLPYPKPEELVHLTVSIPRPDRPTPSRYGLSALDVDTIRTLTARPWRSRDGTRPTRMIADGLQPERLRGYEIDAHYLGLFGVVPHRGRGIQEADTLEGAPRVVVIGYGYWQRRFAGKDDVIGQQLRLDNESYEIVGVLPPGFYRTTPLWLPLRTSAARLRGAAAASATTRACGAD
jgi:hypothetical protein